MKNLADTKTKRWLNVPNKVNRASGVTFYKRTNQRTNVQTCRRWKQHQKHRTKQFRTHTHTHTASAAAVGTAGTRPIALHQWVNTCHEPSTCAVTRPRNEHDHQWKTQNKDSAKRRKNHIADRSNEQNVVLYIVNSILFNILLPG